MGCWFQSVVLAVLLDQRSDVVVGVFYSAGGGWRSVFRTAQLRLVVHQDGFLRRRFAPEFSMVDDPTINQCGRNDNGEEGATAVAADGELVVIATRRQRSLRGLITRYLV